jgi:hypothetical protein
MTEYPSEIVWEYNNVDVILLKEHHFNISWNNSIDELLNRRGMIVFTLTTLNFLCSKCFRNGVFQLVAFLNDEKVQ